jgi:PilZ domain
LSAGPVNLSPAGRRSFCRIDDEIILSFRPLTDRDAAAPQEPGVAGPDTPSETFAVLARIARQREQVRGLLRGLRSDAPRVSRCIAALDERLELLETWVLLTQLGACAEQRHRVRLSAGGMSFRTGCRFSTDSVLLLEIILLPTLTGIQSRGRVLRSVRQLGRDGDLPYLTAIEFIDMKESTRDVITRHVLARQGRRRRHDDQPNRRPSPS